MSGAMTPTVGKCLECAAPQNWVPASFWAKTFEDSKGIQLPGVSAFGHCLNVGCVAERILESMPPHLKRLLPTGAATLAALHDVGKITLGFQAKCSVWLNAHSFDELTLRQIAHSVTDHARVSQFFLQQQLKTNKAHGWAVAVGAHHGTPKPPPIKSDNVAEPTATAPLMEAARRDLASRLIERFGPLPTTGPRKDLGRDDPTLWLLAGLITVADWIGSNEDYFPADADLPFETSRLAAGEALASIGWPGARLTEGPFASAFDFAANPIQAALLAAADAPGLFIVEAPMGCGKTEAALAAARRLIAAGHHHGLYFALPTQVTSNRIHRRVASFLRATLADAAHLRLAHGSSWLDDDSALRLRPSFPAGAASRADDDDPQASAQEARSWFASAKHALLAPYGVGTIDQALQGMVAVKHFFVRRFALAGKVVILDEVHSYDVYTGSLVTALVRELRALGCSVIVLSATLTTDRRRELLAAAGYVEATPTPDAYPLLSVGRSAAPVLQIAPQPPEPRTIMLRRAAISEDDTIAELIARAEAGQHVLWIRNTVAEAQDAFRCVRGDLPAAADPVDRIPVGLLHSRFPLTRRKTLEEEWLDRLGKERQRCASGPGSILVATQVVEQSVDIDLDFIVSDLAPTDMLLQRVGRLWRHPRAERAAAAPEFWIRAPELPEDDTFKKLKKRLGRSARVYAPWVLLRSASVFGARDALTLPTDIRALLEATYAAPRPDEPAAWAEAAVQLATEREKLAANAAAAMLVSGRPMVGDEEPAALTRRAGPPTESILLLTALEPLPGRRHRLTAPDGGQREVSDFEWSLDAARFIHPWLVRVPRFLVPATAPRPAWLRLHTHGAVVALLGEQGRLLWDGEPGACSYHPDFGIRAEPAKPSRPAASARPTAFDPDDDDEFDY